jgi:hypothetical protein
VLVSLKENCMRKVIRAFVITCGILAGLALIGFGVY